MARKHSFMYKFALFGPVGLIVNWAAMVCLFYFIFEIGHKKNCWIKVSTGPQTSLFKVWREQCNVEYTVHLSLRVTGRSWNHPSTQPTDVFLLRAVKNSKRSKYSLKCQTVFSFWKHAVSDESPVTFPVHPVGSHGWTSPLDNMLTCSHTHTHTHTRYILFPPCEVIVEEEEDAEVHSGTHVGGYVRFLY